MKPTTVFKHIDDETPTVTRLDISAGVVIEIAGTNLFFEDALHAETFVTACYRGLTDLALAARIEAG
jgi:hypothetical protein